MKERDSRMNDPIRGSAAVDVVIGAAVLIFVILPVFSVIVEKYILLNKAQIIKDAVDITNISAYNSLNVALLGKMKVSMEAGIVKENYQRFLAANLKLDPNLEPLDGSLAEEKVRVEELEIYEGPFPVVCSNGCPITRPSVHSCIVVPLKPALYRQAILSALGKSCLEMHVHVDSEIPVDN